MRVSELPGYAEEEGIARSEIPEIPDEVWEAVAEVEVDGHDEDVVEARSIAEAAVALFKQDLDARVERIDGRATLPTGIEVPTILEVAEKRHRRASR